MILAFVAASGTSVELAGEIETDIQDYWAMASASLSHDEHETNTASERASTILLVPHLRGR